MHVNQLQHYNPDQPEKANPDEKCFAILETDLRTENSEGKSVVHRFQVVDFLRGNTRLREVRDLNKEGLFSVLEQHPPMRIWSLLEHSVGECKLMADEARARKKVRDTLAAAQAASTLISDAMTRAEAFQKVIRKASHFGPSRTTGVQRN